jgi:DNA polymerase elongation subunit (family B)
MEVKGLEIVRSSYPVLFQDFLTDVLKKILNGEDKEDIDKFIIDFKDKIKKEKNIFQIATPTGVHGLKKYANKSFNGYKKGSPVHVKSAINFNK